MIVSINGLVLNDPSQQLGYYLDEPLDGLGLPQMRTSSGNRSGRHGGYIGSQFYGMRLVTMTGRIFGSGATPSEAMQDLDAKRKALAAAVASEGPYEVLITTNGGAQYSIGVYLDELDMPVAKAPNTCNFKLSVVAPDINIYDESAGGALSATLDKQTAGGMQWPVTWPITWSGAGAPTVIDNTGQVTLYPVFELTGIMNNPSLTNETTNQSFALTGLTTVATDVVSIDMKNRTVLLNGGSILPYMTSSSTWLALQPGSNSMVLQSTGADDTVTGTITWQAAYRGI